MDTWLVHYMTIGGGQRITAIETQALTAQDAISRILAEQMVQANQIISVRLKAPIIIE